MSDLLDALREALADRYVVERELGRGGMATVFLAEDRKHRRSVAIKVLHAELAAALGAERFLREIEIAARLQHPHILPLYDSGTAAGFLYYVMPYVEGESLRDRLTREKQLSLEDTLRVATEVAGALAYAHSRGVVHRDIKPENILLSGGSAVVADFGIARAVSVAGEGEHLTQTGTIIGTPAYMSPEQASGSSEIDGRSDQYSLACVVYEMLVGEPPFTGPNARAIIARHSMDTVSPPSIVRSTIPDAVEVAILRALAKVPADRYPTTALFAEALGAPGVVAGPRARVTRPSQLATHWLGLPRAAVVGIGAVVVIAGAWTVFWRPGLGGRAGAAGGLDPRHLAVLYFDDRSETKSLGYLADGLTEALIDQLGQVQALTVVSTSGVSRFRGSSVSADSVARTFNVGSVIQGSVDGVGGEPVHVAIRLVDGGSGDVVQRAGFDVPATNLLAARDSLAQEASRLLRSWLGEEVRVRELQSGTTNVEAWTLVLRAEKRRKDAESLLRTDQARAFGEFDAADSLLGQAESADRQWVTPVAMRGQIALRRSRLLQAKLPEALRWADIGAGHAERGLTLNPRSAAALELRGTIEYWRALLGMPPDAAGQAREFAAAQKDLEAAVDVDPKRASAYNVLSALYYKTKDRAAAALAARQALAADPYFTLADAVLWRLFQSLYDIEQFDQAKTACEEGRRRFPQDYHFAECELWLMTAPAVQPNVAEAWRLLSDVGRLVPAPLRDLQLHVDRMVVGGVIGRAGLLDSARHVLVSARLGREVDPHLQLVCWESVMRTMIGDRDEAIDLLKQCVVANPGHVFQRGGDVHWWWRNLQSHPRFRDVVGTKR